MSIHIYTGDGKGKTTCATGLSARFACYGKTVDFFKFLKCETDGECKILKEHINFYCVEEKFGFVWEMSESERLKIADKTYKLWQRVKSSKAEMIVLDEIFGAVEVGFIEKQEVIDFLKQTKSEVVLTGRNPDKEFIDLADYVTEMKKIKHPFDKGIHARQGIEF